MLKLYLCEKNDKRDLFQIFAKSENLKESLSYNQWPNVLKIMKKINMVYYQNIVINSKNHTRSLDGTFAQAFSSKFNRGPGAKERNRRRSAAIQFGCQRLQSLAGAGVRSWGEVLMIFLLA